ncbi:Dot/Icm T4SS effector AnkY/LegA9 [Fluoribacter gormanii]|uniref:Ankyrin repeat n=1 Tax=Fluoribacter gormanii TaxID=464 RepID=A0A377GN68_9GAMM|nr:Dot/Icm T4SS effector AnkY/LegA9 [Fluoribacter gormanii]KTD05127.1 Ankyrin-repeat containing protein, substrate of the Dot/Icm secretion system [Fluoribacter gormanii]MCW8445573.1 ankyrin repeat domain-containing protein [Fluoribacter gormanii]SIR00144.1 Ankyrin repeat [Fluoribacter gormanii]STO26053.1 transient-receptor-potential calcium channel protein [Fluoribacter gormanii]
MGKVILIHANCRNPTAKGDFAFAANIAKDLFHELQDRGVNDIDVILVSTLDGIGKFTSMYGAAVNGRISVEETSIGLSSLEEFDAVENTVVAFIDANRCKFPAADLVKRVLSPDSKILFVGNVNQLPFADLFSQTLYRMQAKLDQPGLYESFNDRDMMVGSAGLGQDRLGLPTIAKAEDLPDLNVPEQSAKALLPKKDYGFMYLAAVDPSKDYKLIAQYIKLSGQDTYVLVGDFASNKYDIRYAYEHDTTLTTSKPLPQIEYHQSLPYKVMRQAVAHAESPLVLSTGVTSTLEAMRDKKLTYYQDMLNNTEFVAAYLLAVKSMVASDNSLFGAMPDMIIELSDLLFANKPLSRKNMERTQDLLEISSVSSRLADMNQAIIEQASGKIASKLLGFLGNSRKTQDPVQLATVCASLRKSGEMGSPVYDQALRRAATWGRLFELKVLIKSMSLSEMDKADRTYERTALHWAVTSRNYDCAKALVNAGVSLDLQDKEGQTALHKAVKNGDRQMIKMLMQSGASVDIADKYKSSPQDCAPDTGTLLFFKDCHAHLHQQTANLNINGSI